MGFISIFSSVFLISSITTPTFVFVLPASHSKPCDCNRKVYGQHLWSYAPLGVVSSRLGPLMAASDRFEINVTGVGGHGAVPQGTRDAVVCASHIVLQLHHIVSRSISPLDPAVLTVGTINSGYISNVIADKARLEGTAEEQCSRWDT